MTHRPLVAWSAAMPLAVVALLSAVSAAQPQDRWEPAIAAFEARDRESAPAEEGIVFVGSSSIVRWKVEQSFPDRPVTNRGFGGSQIADSVRYAQRIVLPYRPKMVVFYAGDNDIAAGKTPEQVAEDFRAFVAKVHGSLPQARIVFIGIKPSLRRWALIDKMRQANRLIRMATEQDERLVFVDVEGPMLGADGKPRPELLAADGLHLSDEGYRLWADLLRPHLELR